MDPTRQGQPIRQHMPLPAGQGKKDDVQAKRTSFDQSARQPSAAEVQASRARANSEAELHTAAAKTRISSNSEVGVDRSESTGRSSRASDNRVSEKTFGSSSPAKSGHDPARRAELRAKIGKGFAIAGLIAGGVALVGGLITASVFFPPFGWALLGIVILTVIAIAGMAAGWR